MQTDRMDKTAVGHDYKVWLSLTPSIMMCLGCTAAQGITADDFIFCSQYEHGQLPPNWRVVILFPLNPATRSWDQKCTTVSHIERWLAWSMLML